MDWGFAREIEVLGVNLPQRHFATKRQFTLPHHNRLRSVFKIIMNCNENAYRINLLFDSISIRVTVSNLFG
jgi:hypothetical protein